MEYELFPGEADSVARLFTAYLCGDPGDHLPGLSLPELVAFYGHCLFLAHYDGALPNELKTVDEIWPRLVAEIQRRA
jgi:hypothetical protein